MNHHTAIRRFTACCKKATIVLPMFIFSFISVSATYPPYRAPFYRGYLILKNKDTLYGEISIKQLEYSFRDYRDHDEIVLRRKGRSIWTNQEIRIKRSDIAFVRLFYKLVYVGGVAYSENFSGIPSLSQKTKLDSTLERYTNYENISCGGHIYLARLLAAGKANVYDFFQNPEKEITDPHPSLYAIPMYKPLFGRIPLLVVADEKVERVPTRFTLQLRRSRFILRFINRRYKTHLQLSEFASNIDMFNYVAAAG